ncbi:hypothetical protein [Streptomyces caelestis]|uniref:hypothetical protein n=1 Tax=Streptomyces caelestis TaxID=36816 RepID=UPI003667960F
MAVSGLLLTGLPALYFLTVHGCGEEEDRLAEVMAGETVLDAAPDGADGKDRYQECDDDDRFVVVGARYRYDGSPENVLRYYGETARADGWRPRAGAGDDTAPGCFAKSVGGTTAYLDVTGPDDGLLHVEIVADRAQSQWC